MTNSLQGRRLGYLVPEFPAQTHAFFWREIQALRRLGIEVSLLSTRRPPEGSCPHEFADEASRTTHYVFPPHWASAVAVLATRPLGLLRCLAYVLSLSESRWGQRLKLLALIPCAADLVAHARRKIIEHVHVHSCADAAHLVALARRMGGPPYSLTLHGDLQVYGCDHPSKVEGAEFVSAVTRALQEQLTTQLGLPVERVPVIWMGVETQKFSEAGFRDWQPGTLKLLTVARLNPAKGHRYALQAMRRVFDDGIDIHYTIIGAGPAKMSIEEDIERLGLASRVTLLGSVGESDVLAWMRRCDVFLLPSSGHGEAAPVAVMEAMSAGLPVVVSIIGGTPDMIDDGVDGFLVPQEDVDAIATRLLELARDPALRVRLSAAATHRARRSFDSALTSSQRAHRIFDREPSGASSSDR